MPVDYTIPDPESPFHGGVDNCSQYCGQSHLLLQVFDTLRESAEFLLADHRFDRYKVNRARTARFRPCISQSFEGQHGTALDSAAWGGSAGDGVPGNSGCTGMARHLLSGGG